MRVLEQPHLQKLVASRHRLKSFFLKRHFKIPSEAVTYTDVPMLTQITKILDSDPFFIEILTKGDILLPYLRKHDICYGESSFNSMIHFYLTEIEFFEQYSLNRGLPELLLFICTELAGNYGIIQRKPYLQKQWFIASFLKSSVLPVPVSKKA